MTGLFLAAVTLVRPNGVLLIGVLGVWAAVVIMTNKQRWCTVCIQLLIILVIGAMCVLPWTYRNYVVSRAFVLVSTGSGEVLNGAYNDGVISQPPDHRGFWNPPPGSRIHDDVGYTPTDDKNDAQQALYWMVSHPTEVFSFYANIRFRSPIEPLLVMLVSVALCKFTGLISKSCKNKCCWINTRKTTILFSRL